MLSSMSKSLAVRTNYLVIIIVALYLASQVIIQLLFGRNIGKYLYILLVFIQVIIIFLPTFYFAIKHNLGPEFFRIRKIKISEAFLIILMSVLSSYIASVLNTLVVFFLKKLVPVKMDGIPAPQTILELLTQIIVIALIPAVCEEFFFRGVIFRVFEGLGLKMAILVSALYFTLFHFDIRNFMGPLFLGILIAWYCYRTGSIFAAVLAHFTNNFIAVLISWFNRDIAADPVVLTVKTMESLIIYACFLGIVLFIFIKAFEAITRNKAKSDVLHVPKLSPTIILHWPVCILYCTYVIITVILIL